MKYFFNLKKRLLLQSITGYKKPVGWGYRIPVGTCRLTFINGKRQKNGQKAHSGPLQGQDSDTSLHKAFHS